MLMKKLFLVLVLVVATVAMVSAQAKKREMRAVWIATVANIDWPSQRNLNVKQQKAELLQILDSCAALNINTIVLQIRPTADAFYTSTLEPWSHWLTGKQGVRPQTFYDPLQFAIDESHKRFIDVHVWLNPYRVTNSDNLDLLSKDHLYYKNKDLFVKYGGKYYFDPGLDETRAFLNKVVEDIVQRYDVDAIHFDDYFYPYKVANEEFPDYKSFRDNPRGYSPMQKDDWRRNNVNMIIAELQQTIKSIKPWVEFGISPFGVWRNKSSDPRGSDTQAGVQNYDDLYADILKWLNEGTIDYVTPQLYWEIGKKVADYAVLAKWWSENSYGKNLYVGLYATQLGNKDAAAAWRKGNELARQMQHNKAYKEIDGVILFSAKGILKNLQGINDSLRSNYFKYPAITPINRNIKGEASAEPQNVRTVKDGSEAYLLWDKVEEEGGCRVAYYVVYAFKGKKVGDFNDPTNILARTTDNCLDLRDLDKKLHGSYTFVVTAINKFKHENQPTYSVTRKL